jgi:amino acid adenylation domain-containing protein
MIASNKAFAAPFLADQETPNFALGKGDSQDYPRNACITELIARQADKTPNASALVMGTQVLSYGELNRRANQLAHYLQESGAGPNVPVGLYLERSLEMVIGLLGILKAGAAYVPMDASYPVERVSFMLHDAGVPILVTQEHLAEHVSFENIQILCIDTDTELLKMQRESDPATSVTTDDLAYIVYTSGSTGQPKGVQITHDGLLNLVFWHQRAFSVTSADLATQVASPAFDALGWELWPYLTCGASLYLPDEETRVSPPMLRDWLVNNQITISFLPTALAESVIVLEWPERTALRFLLTGADTLRNYPPPGLPFTLINNYGPSEATVVATSGPVLATNNPDMPPSIGRPIANTEIYILDEHLQLVPTGEPGELYIGGIGLAKGYLNRPELTDENFIPHPFSARPGARLYKTGDQARFLPDGQIAFLGRTDFQIKIRGYRIEPDEIVSVLNRHPFISSSYVLAREDIPGDKRLVAYIVPVFGVSVSAASLQELLSTYLPDYMIPAAFVLLTALPRTTNGKVDRGALPVPDAQNTLRDEIAQPSTPVEARVAEILASLLNLDHVGIDDNFFMLGGHSLLGTQVITRVSESFGVELTLRTLFGAPTVRQLSAEIERSIVARLESMSEEEALHLLQ